MTQHNNWDWSLTRNWIAFLDQQGKSQHTIKAYDRGLCHFIRWYEQGYESSFDPQRVMPRDVRAWRSYQHQTERAAVATINQRVVAVTRFFQWARSRGICHENPAEGVKSIQVAANKPQGLKPNDLRRLLRAAYGNHRDYAILEMLVGTGLRIGELLALLVGDVEINERSGKVIVREGKYDSYREIPLSGDVRRALTTYLEETHPAPENSGEYLWFSNRGPLKHRSSVTRMLDKYAASAQIKSVSPHRLRHTFATRYLKANPDDLRGLARLLGHRNLNTVMIYTEPDMEDLAERIERIESQV